MVRPSVYAIIAVLMISSGCQHVSLPMAAPAASQGTQALYMNRSNSKELLMLHLVRVLHKQPKVPGVTSSYVVSEMYENAAPGTWLYYLVETRVSNLDGRTTKYQVTGQFDPRTEDVKVKKSTVVKP